MQRVEPCGIRLRPLQPLRLVGRRRSVAGSSAGCLAEGADLGSLIPGTHLFGEHLRTVLVDLLLTRLCDSRVLPAPPLGFEDFLLPAEVVEAGDAVAGPLSAVTAKSAAPAINAHSRNRMEPNSFVRWSGELTGPPSSLAPSHNTGPVA
ncbi:hypothetical protein ACIODX_15710 [Streptomyces sp. NPDC088190]|uniref:hypothetical protein n=1 Tax=unclassified Streptomyces TaxID=2593676 RepID=UPI002E77DB92|nr:hypothetical protein [Streptomyces sp. JV190]MEE1845187.1 hypothetical protein [Streptomyces sp. JV190]